MATILEYCKKLSDDQLLDIVDEYAASGDPVMMDTAVEILKIVAERNPTKFDVQAAWSSFQEHYMPKENGL
mgnify:CR=1 FL=1